MGGVKGAVQGRGCAKGSTTHAGLERVRRRVVVLVVADAASTTTGID